MSDAADRYRQVMESMAEGDSSMVGDYIADDIVYHQIGAPALRGKDAVLASFEGFEGVDWSADIHDVLTNDEHMVALVEATVKAGDDQITFRTAEIMHIDEDGKVTERWAFSDDTQAITDFFGKLAAG